MIKYTIAITAFLAATTAVAQPQGMTDRAAAVIAACPLPSRYVAIRHSTIMPGKWGEFQQAVADHAAWYAKHGDKTTTKIARMLDMRNGAAVPSEAEAVTITEYSGKQQPEHDADYEAFTAKYRSSSTIKDEMRVCMPR